MKRVISVLLIVMMLSPFAVSAQTWITVSSWAYNDVSNFKKEGMLPESLDETGDFTKPVTRMQFAEILYSALTNVADSTLMGNVHSLAGFADTDDQKVLYLYWRGIMEGENTGEFDEYGMPVCYFYPDRLLTREEMAVIMDRTVEWFLRYDFNEGSYELPADYDEISDWAKESTIRMMSIGLISGVGENRFAPKDNLTIEQAISIVYRLYSHLPTAQAADGANIEGDTETEVQTYSNGVVETKMGNMLYLNYNGQRLMEFETDIYANIFCETVDGKMYAAAQNCYGKTDIYDLSQQTITAKIPYPIYNVDSEYIIAKSSVIGPFSFGLYDWSGDQVTDVKYSQSELEELKNNNFQLGTAEYKSPSGMIYFSDWNDNGSVCVIDSNGENKRKLSDKKCTSRIYYADGRIYFEADDNGKSALYSIKTDGTGEVKISEYTNQSFWTILNDSYVVCDEVPTDRNSSGMLTYTKYNYDYSINSKGSRMAKYGEWIYYLSYNNNDVPGAYNSICRFRITDDNEVEKEKITDDIIYSGFSAQFIDGKMYFLDEKERMENSETGTLYSDLYCFDGDKVTKINGDMGVVDYCFYNDKLVMFVGDGYDNYVTYSAELDGSNPQVMEDVEAAKERYKEEQNKMNEELNNGGQWSETDTYAYEDISDDKFTVYSVSKIVLNNEEIESHENVYIRDTQGNETKISDTGMSIMARYGDILIYSENEGLINNSVISYDMNTGKKRVIADNKYLQMTNIEQYIFFYDKNLNIWRYDISTDTLEEIAPNSGSDKYGKVADLFGKNDGMYKIDTNGNYTLVTNKEYAANSIYVENGTGKTLMF